jgi:hypothetical protein
VFPGGKPLQNAPARVAHHTRRELQERWAVASVATNLEPLLRRAEPCGNLFRGEQIVGITGTGSDKISGALVEMMMGHGKP